MLALAQKTPGLLLYLPGQAEEKGGGLSGEMLVQSRGEEGDAGTVKPGVWARSGAEARALPQD